MSGFRGRCDARRAAPAAGGEVHPIVAAASGRGGGNGASFATQGSCTVALDGELYGLDELRRQLQVDATSPAAVVLAAWRRWSTACLPRLDGEFALALLDGDELLLYRDPTGLRSLYWAATGPGALAFATRLRALVELPQVGRRVARRSLHEYLRFGDIAAPHTLLEGVHALEAGKLLRCSPAGIAVQPPPAPDAPRPPAQFDAAVDAVEAALARSVHERLNGARRPAAFLSSGVDSSLICALAARERPDLQAITVGVDGTQDESPAARRIAQHLGVRHEVLRFSGTELALAFERLATSMDQPMADPATPASVLAFDHCRERHDVVLDGTGADEVVGAMPPRHVRLAVQYASLLPPAARRAIAGAVRAVPALAGYAPIVDFEHPADTMIRWQGFTRREIEALCGDVVSFEHTTFYRTFARFPRPAHFERYSALVDAMPCDRLTQAVAATGATVRYPFHGLEASALVRRLRTDFRDAPGAPKRILRAVLARHVPQPLWDRPKHGFNVPLAGMLRADGHRLVRTHLDPDRWRPRALLSVQALGELARRYEAGEERLAFRVWTLVVLDAWLHANVDAAWP
ncbi:asparagine synthase-related protein [Azohydromonas sp.]|uniref:asparagine synthetase B family protein n=1 Tax=Azohydromonas sp. TaxID=1872666 RepID=UPI002C68878E|nr:asparagine synthase-related protein [Azohydromonas sp.]HMM87264.1 asparagine synthase-related protein [Azohydromonas sp.]